MNTAMKECMREAMRLMQTGNLNAATAAIQAGLGSGAHTRAAGPASAFVAREDARRAYSARSDAPRSYSVRGDAPLEGEFRVVDDVPEPRTVEAPRREAPDPGVTDRAEPRVQRRSFQCSAGTREYRLFVPSAWRGQPLPLVVMLHGCTQSPDDFARGTRMDELAEERGCFVVYPAQSKSHNGSNCWNWFMPADQRRDRGEPAIIAGMARAVVDEFGLDSSRVYVAGLSAGGAMAAILGHEYPDVFAAVGVHSGLPWASAHDVPSAFAAMHRKGAGPSRANGSDLSGAIAIPSIVFHGDRDTTVTPVNGEAIVQASIARLQAADGATPAGGAALGMSVVRGKAAGGRSFTRTTWADPDGAIVAEQWVVHDAGHAWSGGHKSGTYTDPRGPDASAEMLRFFSESGARAGRDEGCVVRPAPKAGSGAAVQSDARLLPFNEARGADRSA